MGLGCITSPMTCTSVGAAGGQPELLYKDVTSAALSRDGKVLALLRHGASISLSSPPGSEPRPYREAPFTGHHFDSGILRFSPQGDRLVAWMWQEGKPTEFWILPLPRGKPFQVLRNSTADCLFPQPFSVLSDGRHIVLEMQPRPDWSQHLVVANLERDAVQPLTRTTHSENQPALSPAGDRIAFTVRDGNYDLVVVPLDGSPMRDFLATAWYTRASRAGGQMGKSRTCLTGGSG